MSPESLVSYLILAVKKAFLVSGQEIFSPDNMALMGASRADIEQGLLQLVHSGWMYREATVYCPNGHEVWSDRQMVLTESLPHSWECQDCSLNSDPDDPTITVSFRLEPAVTRELSAKSSAEFGMLYPFMFCVREADALGHDIETKRVVVLIADYDLAPKNTAWMGVPTLADGAWVPDVDLVKEEHDFATEREALLFIRNWWARQEVTDVQGS